MSADNNWHGDISEHLAEAHSITNWTYTLSPVGASDLLDEWEAAQRQIRDLQRQIEDITDEANAWRTLASELSQELTPVPTVPAWTVIA